MECHYEHQDMKLEQKLLKIKWTKFILSEIWGKPLAQVRDEKGKAKKNNLFT